MRYTALTPALSAIKQPRERAISNDASLLFNGCWSFIALLIALLHKAISIPNRNKEKSKFNIKRSLNKTT